MSDSPLSLQRHTHVLNSLKNERVHSWVGFRTFLTESCNRNL
nr:MAG TPA: hypothetical protein [Caudoviricetes sp.]